MRIIRKTSAVLILSRAVVCAVAMSVLLAGCASTPVDYYSRAKAYQEAGQFEKAIADYTQFILLNPRYAHAYYNRGRAYAASGEYDRAITDFDQVLAIRPQLPEVYVTRADAYKNMSQFDRALMDYDKATKINPNYAEAYFGRAEIYGIKGRHDLALADYDRLLDICPEDITSRTNRRIYLSRAQAYYHLGEYDKSWQDIGRVPVWDFRLGYTILADQAFLQALRSIRQRIIRIMALHNEEPC